MSENQLLELILQKVTNIEQDVAGVKEDVSVLKEDVSGLKEDVSDLKEDVSGLKEDVSELKGRMANVELRVGALEQHVKNIQLTLENEIRFSICAIADGHEDITRKLDDVIKFQGRYEKLTVRVNLLEADMRDQKTATELLRERIG